MKSTGQNTNAKYFGESTCISVHGKYIVKGVDISLTYYQIGGLD